MRTKDIGATVLLRRKELNLRQSELADLSGVSERFIREVEKGKPSTQLDKVISVLDVLGLELHLRHHNPLRRTEP